ncbi:MAG: GNAT family N-acetyltransferase [Gallionellaceae bacterium]|nr:GNAT family N-acetyltransferase [Gallionellaceae bacterium]
MSNPFTVHLVSWQDGEPLLRAIRETVFIKEQGVPPELEWDGHDAACRHVLVLSEQGKAIGCGRITPHAQIGRVAVLPEWRGKKVGTAILEALLNYAHSQRYPLLELNSQTQNVPLYRRFDFSEVGDVFMDANIPHIKMQLRLPHADS